MTYDTAPTIGGFKRARAYVNKVFGLEDELARLHDGRSGPKLPLGAALATWFWAMVRRLPSTEQVGDMLLDAGWRRRLGLTTAQGGSPDTLARILDGLSIDELGELCLDVFFTARRAKVLDAGPYGQRCAIVDLNELFTSTKVHCEQCQTRIKKTLDAQGNLREITEYFHQAVALVFVSGEIAWPLGWEILRPGEGELTAAVRLLERLLPRLRSSLDLVLGDRLYCCRLFFQTVCRFGVNALAISSGTTEMDKEMELLVRSEPPRRLRIQDVDVWSMDSEAWQRDLQRSLHVAHYVRRYDAPDYKHERRHLRIVCTAPVEVLPEAQGWRVGRARWIIENGAFNRLTRDYGLTHNFHHDAAAIMALLVLRSLACAITLAYHRFATARTARPPRPVRWFQLVFVEDWVRYRDAADAEAAHARA
jgi:hypothetical protein